MPAVEAILSGSYGVARPINVMIDLDRNAEHGGAIPDLARDRRRRVACPHRVTEEINLSAIADQTPDRICARFELREQPTKMRF